SRSKSSASSAGGGGGGTARGAALTRPASAASGRGSASPVMMFVPPECESGSVWESNPCEFYGKSLRKLTGRQLPDSSARRHRLQQRLWIAYHPSTHHRHNLAGVSDVGRGIGVEDEHVGEFARFDAAEFVALLQRPGVVDRRRLQRRG